MKKTMIIICLISIVIVLLVVRSVKGFIPFPIGVRHIINSMTNPQDLYKPIVVDRFLFSERNFSKTYYFTAVPTLSFDDAVTL